MSTSTVTAGATRNSSLFEDECVEYRLEIFRALHLSGLEVFKFEMDVHMLLPSLRKSITNKRN